MGLINSAIKSKATGKSGFIVDADKKALLVSFEYGGKISVPIDRFDVLFDCDQEVRDDYEAHVNSFKKPKKVKIGTKNIAIKCNYCDGGIEDNGIGFAGVCSDENLRYNMEKRTYSQCNDPACACNRYYRGQLERDEIAQPCYECRMLKEWKAWAGIYKTGKKAGQPMTFKDIAPQSVCFLTTILPGQEEKDRVIFAIFYVDKTDSGGQVSEGYVSADPKHRILLNKEEAQQLKYWDFYSNTGNKLWGSVLHRYINDPQAVEIIEKAITIKKDSADREKLQDLLDHFRQIKKLDH